MANLSSITLPNNNTYNFKDNNAIPKNEDGNTQYLKRPSGLRGSNDLTLQGLFNATRANRLAFLPPDQIIIEKTIDGGTTWTDAEVSDNTKLGLFSETRNVINIPLIDGVRNPLCGIRVTFTAMKYNVPSGTIETEKYNYWNSNYVLSTERYNQIKQFYFWLSSSDGSIGIKIQGAKGSSANSWQSLFNDTDYYMTGWSGSDYVRLNGQYVFGGSKTQTGNSFWNYRITFMSKGKNGTDDFDTGSKTQYQNIAQIRAYGDSYWVKGNEYAATDKIYTHDINKNVTFPAKVTASGGFSGNLTGNVSGNATNVTGTVAIDHGGTGATSAAAARTNLGLGSAALASTAASVGNNTNLPTGAAVQTYVSSLVAGVLHYKGTKSTVANLPTSGNTTGDVWHVTQDGSEWAWDGSAWQELGTAIDLSNYVTNVTASTVSVGSASAGTAIPADDITAWTTNTPTVVTPATVVTGGSTATITPVTKKTVVTGGSTTEYKPVTGISTGSGTAASASVANGVLTITNGSTPITSVTASTVSIKPYTGLTTGDSVTNGTAVTVYKSLTTGPAATVTAGTAASLSYTSKSIPNISVTSKNVVSGITVSK